MCARDDWAVKCNFSYNTVLTISVIKSFNMDMRYTIHILLHFFILP